MSMSTHIIGFRPPDDKWKKMRAIYDACVDAGIEIPDEVVDFFGNVPPDESGVEVPLGKKEGVEEWQDKNTREGFQVEISKLPNVKYIRFYNSW